MTEVEIIGGLLFSVAAFVTVFYIGLIVAVIICKFKGHRW